MQLEYFWTDCPDGLHVAVNYTIHEDRVTGSIRRWSPDGRVNVGRKFEIPAAEVATGQDGGPAIVLEGVCSGPLQIPLDAKAAAQAGLSWKTAA
jgi:hypothetical protein